MYPTTNCRHHSRVSWASGRSALGMPAPGGGVPGRSGRVPPEGISRLGGGAEIDGLGLASWLVAFKAP